ncbi:MAG: LD-carboxypeptidase [Chitinophagaceae bacterium]|nr:MAG: LD-carboxypeptidase [Chitinophagaceae bacterium]
MVRQPAFLKKGDTVGIVCPAGFMALAKVKSCIDELQNWGYQVKIGKTVGGTSTNYFSGTDDERLNDLQQLLDDDNVKAILCARGGYGISRIIDNIDFTKFLKNPKWIIGFSDVTVLHSNIYRNYKVATLHAPMAAAFNDGESKNEYVQSLYRALSGEKMEYIIPKNELNRIGTTTGILVGGNLTLMANLIGTNSDVDTNGKILFLEDVGEYLYNIDRMFLQLKRSGKLKNLAGLIIGEFSDSKDTVQPFGKSVYTIIKDNILEYKFPVCFGFPVGHTKNNYALKIGGYYELNIDEVVILKELEL